MKSFIEILLLGMHELFLCTLLNNDLSGGGIRFANEYLTRELHLIQTSARNIDKTLMGSR